jgi:hypothetical protein
VDLRLAHGYTVIDPGALDADHWVRDVKDLEAASFDIGIGKRRSSSSPVAGSGAVRLCEAYRITIGEETLEVYG